MDSSYKNAYGGLAVLFSEITNQRLRELAAVLNAVLSEKLSGSAAATVPEQKGEVLVKEKENKAQFRVAVVGGLFTGKSTLINALLGEEILPTANMPCTEVVTEVKYADRSRAALRFLNPLPDNVRLNGTHVTVRTHMYQNNMTNIPPLEIRVEDLGDCISIPDYYSEEAIKINPVTRAEVFLNSQVLEHGLELVDFPGLTSDHSNERRVLKRLSKMDAVVFVLRSDMLCSQEEFEFIRKINEIGVGDPIFVINRCDLFGASKGLDAIKTYVRNKLSRYTSRGEKGFFFVSALDGLAGTPGGKTKKYQKSGIPELKKELLHLSGSDEKKSAAQSTAPSPLVPDLHKKFYETEKRKNNAKSVSHKHTAILAKNPTSDDYIAFAKSLIEKYQWPQGVKKSLLDRLQRIKAKQQDKTLSLSIIGEFSVGKSTFINGLLRTELLESSSVQGTTVAATVMEYSQARVVKVVDKRDRSRSFEVNNDKEQQEYIKKFSTDPSFAKGVDSLIIGMPNKNLKQGIRIIDTPGTNALEAWHEETTIRAIRELSDASLILIDATKVLPKSQKTFIHNYLEDVLAQCVYVVTKIDLVRERERQEVLEYIRQQISYEFDIDDPFVVPYASLDVLEAACSKEPVTDAKTVRLLEASYQSETDLYRYVEDHKEDALANKLSLLLEDMYSMIGENMKQISGDYQKEHDLLAKTKRTNLNDFVSKQTREKCDAFADKAEQLIYQLNEQSESLTRKYKEEILGELDGCTTKDGIKNYVNNRFAKACQERSNRLTNMLGSRSQKLEKEAMWYVDVFRTAFKREYERLGLMPMDHSMLSTKLSVTGIKNIAVSTGDANRSIDAASWENLKALGGGAAAGAVIGTFFGPGIGTAIGAAIGGFLFSPGVDKIKQEAKNSLKDPMDDYFNQVLMAQHRSLNEYARQLKQYIADEIAKHFAEYNAFIENAVKADEKKKEEIESKISGIQTDMDEIDMIKEKLSQSRVSFR